MTLIANAPRATTSDVPPVAQTVQNEGAKHVATDSADSVDNEKAAAANEGDRLEGSARPTVARRERGVPGAYLRDALRPPVGEGRGGAPGVQMGPQ